MYFIVPMCIFMINRSYALFRASMKRLPKMETIVEEVYVIKKPLSNATYKEEWKEHWHASRDNDWGQWSDIEYNHVSAEADYDAYVTSDTKAEYDYDYIDP